MIIALAHLGAGSVVIDEEGTIAVLLLPVCLALAVEMIQRFEPVFNRYLLPCHLKPVLRFV